MQDRSSCTCFHKLNRIFSFSGNNPLSTKKLFIMKKLHLLVVLLFGLGLIGHGQASLDYTIMIEDIEFQPGVTIDININVYVNEHATNQADHGKIFAIEGMAHTANCWIPLAEALFEQEDPALEINEFYAIDMPGKGLSGLPEGNGFMFENLYIEDYICILRAVLSYLNDVHGVYPSTIMGHSLAGLEVILLQQTLLDENTNMRKAYRIKNAICLAPAPPAECPWYFLDSGMGEARLGPMTNPMPGYGMTLNIPPPVWPFMFFINPFYNPTLYPPPNPNCLVPNAPFPSQAVANGYIGYEPGPLIFQLGGVELDGYPFKERPAVDDNIFMPKNGVELTLIADQYDMLMQVSEMEYLYMKLTKDNQKERFLLVTGDETCHDTHISDPHAIAALLNKPSFFKSMDADEEGSANISSVRLSPNPAGEHVNISFSLAAEGNIQADLFDSNGKQVMSFTSGHFEAGLHVLNFSTERLSPGLYFCKIKSDQDCKVSKLLVK